MHRFTIDGNVGEQLYDELEAVAQHRQYAREWVDALTRYCLAREDTGPLAAWTRPATAEAEARAEQWLTAASMDVSALAQDTNGNRSYRQHRYPGLLARKQMPTEIAARLIDAAFLMGVTAARKRVLPAAVERRFRAP